MEFQLLVLFQKPIKLKTINLTSSLIRIEEKNRRGTYEVDDKTCIRKTTGGMMEIGPYENQTTFGWSLARR